MIDFVSRYRELGTKDFVDFFIKEMSAFVSVYNSKPDINDISASMMKKSLIALDSFIESLIVSTGECRVGEAWKLSDYCDICFVQVVDEIIDFLDPENLICLVPEDLIKVVKSFYETNLYTFNGFRAKFRKRDNKFEISKRKYKKEIETISYRNHDIPEAQIITTWKANNPDLFMGLLINSFIK